MIEITEIKKGNHTSLVGGKRGCQGSPAVLLHRDLHQDMMTTMALDVARGFELLVSWKVIFRPESKLKSEIRKEFKLKRISSEWMA